MSAHADPRRAAPEAVRELLRRLSAAGALVVALVSLLLAWRRIFQPAAECKPGEVCAVPAVRRTYKAIFWAVAILVAVAVAFPYAAPLFY